MKRFSVANARFPPPNPVFCRVVPLKYRKTLYARPVVGVGERLNAILLQRLATFDIQPTRLDGIIINHLESLNQRGLV
jgi:hypothetical protein